jgi:Fuc2NAc and GlcNAc transferase
MVLVMLIAWVTLGFQGLVPWQWATALTAGGALTALVGGIDDLRSLSARTRLIAHLAAGLGMAFAFAASHGAIHVTQEILLPAWVAPLFVVLFVVWFINLFNFMDGIDGIAAGQSASTCAVAAALCLAANQPVPALCFALLSAVSLGFLTRNWHPARIFMGDVGSGFMGFALAATSLFAEQRGGLTVALFALLSGTFIVDATYTLIRRLVAGEAVSQAHRDHAYQHATQRGASHAKVAGSYIAVNLLWLAPLAWCGATWTTWTPALIPIAFVPLVALCVRLRAGIRGG